MQNIKSKLKWISMELMKSKSSLKVFKIAGISKKKIFLRQLPKFSRLAFLSRYEEEKEKIAQTKIWSMSLVALKDRFNKFVATVVLLRTDFTRYNQSLVIRLKEDYWYLEFIILKRQALLKINKYLTYFKE